MYELSNEELLAVSGGNCRPSRSETATATGGRGGNGGNGGDANQTSTQRGFLAVSLLSNDNVGTGNGPVGGSGGSGGSGGGATAIT